MATYLITGCAGFIGSKVSEFLLSGGQEVVGIDNLNDAYDVRLKQWRLAQLQGRPNFNFHGIDITDRTALLELFRGQFTSQDPKFDAVLNLAARAGVRRSVEDPWIYFQTNVTGTLNLLEMCRAYGVPKFILSSTSSLYGANNPRPFREDANTDHPLSPYAASKKGAEAVCHTYHYLHGIDVTVFRYFTVYGPAGRPDMSLFRFTQWICEGRPVTIFGDGQQSRDFTYVDDIARGTIAGLRPLGYEVINLGSDQPVVLMDAIRLVEKHAARKAHLEFKARHRADIVATWADVAKAGRLLGWRPQVLFEEGVRELVRWYRTHRHWAKEISTA